MVLIEIPCDIQHLSKFCTMAGQNSTFLCRICLADGATLPIFGAKKTNLFYKLCVCLNDTIEDKCGYPKNICESCHSTVNIVYDFINKFEHSTQVLEKGLGTVIIKEEQIEIEVEPYVEQNLAMTKLDHTQHITKLEKTEENNETINSDNKMLEEENSNKQFSSFDEDDFIWKEDVACTSLSETSPKSSIKKELVLHTQMLFQPPEPPMRICDFCGISFKNRITLKWHRETQHLKTGATTCPVCHKVFFSNQSMRNHIVRLHPAPTDSTYVCDTCGKEFHMGADLQRHKRRVHSNVKEEHFCKICDRKFANVRNLVIHERSVHTGERPVVCSACGKRFFHKSHLQEHMRLHTGEKPFKCPICDRGFAQRTNLTCHLRSHRISDLDPEQLSNLKPSYLKHMKA